MILSIFEQEPLVPRRSAHSGDHLLALSHRKRTDTRASISICKVYEFDWYDICPPSDKELGAAYARHS